MNQIDFAKVIAYLELAVGKPIAADPKQALERTRIYFDLLNDLPLDALQVAAKRLASERKWATFPQCAEIREMAVDASRGEIGGISPAKAWELAWRAAGRIDLDVSGSADRALDKLPAVVREAVISFGVAALVNGKEPVTVVRAQFVKIFEQIAERARKEAALPVRIKEQLERVGERREKEIASPVAGVIAQIGKCVDQ